MSVYRVSSNKSSVNNFPTVRPTLDLDFANSKTLDPRITFTRASGGSYVGADGLIKLAGVNEARFDHDPYTGESLGLLVEESRTNLFEWSETFVSGWNGFGSGEAAAQVNVDTIFNPFGVLGTVYYITRNEWTRTFNANGLSTLALSFFSKRRFGGLNRDFSTIEIFQQAVGGGSLGTYNFRFDGNNPNSGQFQNIRTERYQNDWYRFSCTLVARPDYNGGVFASNARVDLEGSIADNYFWGIQVEVGAFPTSYIPTEGSTRTRAADNASITGKNFSDFYNSSEGSVRAKFKFYANHGPYCEAVSIAGSGAALMVNDVAGGLVTDCYGGNTVVTGGDNARTKFITGVRAYKFSTNDSVIGCSGANSITIQTGKITNPNTTQLRLGRRGNGSTDFGSMNGHIQNVSYYPKRLPNAQLQALTK